MATSWPASVPDDFLIAGYSETPPDNLIRQKMDAGPSKLRPRSTSAVRPISGKISMTTAQVATLDTFYVTTLSYGSTTFTFTHPRTGSTVNCKFATPPKYEAGGGGYWWVHISLEIQP